MARRKDRDPGQLEKLPGPARSQPIGGGMRQRTDWGQRYLRCRGRVCQQSGGDPPIPLLLHGKQGVGPRDGEGERHGIVGTSPEGLAVGSHFTGGNLREGKTCRGERCCRRGPWGTRQ